jgi:adenosylhomocysteine nucleosidase
VNDVIHNSGFMATGGAITNVGQLAAGPGAGITNVYPGSQPTHSASRSRGIGVVAIKATEARAVIEVFGLTRNRETPSGQDFYTGTVESADGPVELVAARTLEQGQRSIMPTLQNLRRHSNPAVFVLLGIGGAINRDLVVGDVVVATRVVYYDLRRETPEGVHHRGEERHTPAPITHALNSFFTDYDDPARLKSAGPFRVLSGPIGSGDAVVMDAESQIRKFLLAYNEKVLAVDMEAGGLTQFCHETPPPNHPGWLVIRGISDLADHTKTYDHQHSAAHNAAITLQHLIPYLPAKA